MLGCLSGRYKPYYLAANFVSIGVGDEQDRARCNSECLPSLLSLDNAVLNAERMRILENQTGCLEGDLVFCEIAAVLILVPFEAH
jgi:hypothetical protein